MLSGWRRRVNAEEHSGGGCVLVERMDESIGREARLKGGWGRGRPLVDHQLKQVANGGCRLEAGEAPSSGPTGHDDPPSTAQTYDSWDEPTCRTTEIQPHPSTSGSAGFRGELPGDARWGIHGIQRIGLRERPVADVPVGEGSRTIRERTPPQWGRLRGAESMVKSVNR